MPIRHRPDLSTWWNTRIIKFWRRFLFPEGKFRKSGSVGWWYEQNRQNKGRLSKKADLRGLGGKNKRGCPPSLPPPIWSQQLAERSKEGGKAFFAGRGCAGKICGWDKGGEVQRLTDELVLAISPVKCFWFFFFFLQTLGNLPCPWKSSVFAQIWVFFCFQNEILQLVYFRKWTLRGRGKKRKRRAAASDPKAEKPPPCPQLSIGTPRVCTLINSCMFAHMFQWYASMCRGVARRNIPPKWGAQLFRTLLIHQGQSVFGQEIFVAQFIIISKRKYRQDLSGCGGKKTCVNYHFVLF